MGCTKLTIIVLRIMAVFLYWPLVFLSAGNQYEMIWSQDHLYQDCFSQKDLDQAIARAVSEKEEIIVVLRETTNPQFTQEQLNRKITEAVAIKDQVINELNETVLWLPGAANSIWDRMMWDEDDWFIDVHTLATQDELSEAVADAVSEVASAKDIIIAEKDKIIAELNAIIARTSSLEESDGPTIDVHIDRDGDGLTDEQEIARGTDPDSYKINLEEGWNLISVSRVPDDNTTSSVLGPNISNTVWTWEGNRFRIAGELLPLRGYWIYSKRRTDIEIMSPSRN